MTTNRPYLIRAMYDWIADNGLTPYLLVDARAHGVRVPMSAIKDDQVVLNIAVRAVTDLELGNRAVRFMARFAGVSHEVDVPVAAVRAIYAHENGQGMMFPTDDEPHAGVAASSEPPAPDKPPRSGGPKLRVVK